MLVKDCEFFNQIEAKVELVKPFYNNIIPVSVFTANIFTVAASEFLQQPLR